MINTHAKIARVGRLFIAMALSAIATLAQSTYYDETFDSSGLIYTNLYGYPTSGTCDTMTVWSSLNGGYDSDTGTYGDVLNALQSTGASPGVDYDWNWGSSSQYPAGPSCGINSVSFNWKTRLAITNYTNPSIDGTGACQWSSLACSSGTPSCTGGFIIYPSPSCATYIQTLYLVLTTGWGSTCSYVGLWKSISGPAACQ